MTSPAIQRLLSDGDLDFIVASTSERLPAREELRERVVGDEPFRRSLLGGEPLFRKIMGSDDSLARISPQLFFEVLLRRAVEELGRTMHVVDRSAGQRLPVFEAKEVVELASTPAVLDYLVDMLASFTRVESHTTRVFVRRGEWRKTRYSDMDVRSLVRLAQQTDEAERLPVYKRTADACLFILGVFPDFAATARRYPGTGALRATGRRGSRLSTEEYETLGSKMYGLASEHPGATQHGLAPTLRVLGERIIEAKRPLNFVSEHYLQYRRDGLFAVRE